MIERELRSVFKFQQYLIEPLFEFWSVAGNTDGQFFKVTYSKNGRGFVSHIFCAGRRQNRQRVIAKLKEIDITS